MGARSQSRGRKNAKTNSDGAATGAFAETSRQQIADRAMVSGGAQLLALSCLSLPSLIEPFLGAPGAGALIGKSRMIAPPIAATMFEAAPATLLSEVGREGKDRQGTTVGCLIVFGLLSTIFGLSMYDTNIRVRHEPHELNMNMSHRHLLYNFLRRRQEKKLKLD